MSTHFPYPAEEHQLRVAICDPVALAFEWIRAYAESLPGVSADELIDAAMQQVKSKDGYGGYLSRGPDLEGVSVDPLFWDKLAIFKEMDVPEEKRNSFFSCSC